MRLVRGVSITLTGDDRGYIRVSAGRVSRSFSFGRNREIQSALWQAARWRFLHGPGEYPNEVVLFVQARSRLVTWLMKQRAEKILDTMTFTRYDNRRQT